MRSPIGRLISFPLGIEFRHYGSTTSGGRIRLLMRSVGEREATTPARRGTSRLTEGEAEIQATFEPSGRSARRWCRDCAVTVNSGRKHELVAGANLRPP